MAESLYRTSMPAPSLGVNNTNDLFSVLPNQVYRARNCHLDESGMLYTRGGCRTLNTTALNGAVTSFCDFWQPEGSTQRQTIFVTAGTKLYKWNADNDTFVDVKDLTVSDRPMWASFYDGSGGVNAFMCNGADFFRYDGVNFTDITFVTDLKAPRYILVYDDRMLAAGMDNAPYDVYVSESLNGTDWTYGSPDASQYWSVQSTKGNRVTGMELVYNFAAFFQRDTVSIITGADVTDSATEQITVANNYGATSQWSIQSVGNVIYFADENHIYRAVLRQAVENGLEVFPIDRNIRRKYKTVKSHGDIVSVYNKDTEEIYWGVDCNVGSKKDTALVYSIEHSGSKVDLGWIDVWAGWWDNGSSFDPHTFGTVLNDNGIPEIWRGDSSGYVYIQEEQTTQSLYKNYKDYSAATAADIPIEIVTGAVMPSGITLTKSLQYYTPILSQFVNGSTYIEWLSDGSYIMPKTARYLQHASNIPYWNDTSDSTTTTLWGGSIWAHNEYPVTPLKMQEPFRYIQIIIKNDGANARDHIRYGGGELAYHVYGTIRLQG